MAADGEVCLCGGRMALGVGAELHGDVMRIEVRTLIAAPVERVFAVASDIPRWPQSIGAITRVEMLTPGPVAAGTRFRETRTMFGRTESQEMAVAEMLPPSLFVLTAESHGTRYRAVHTFAAERDGTRLGLVFEGVPVTLRARLMAPVGWLMKGHLERQLAADLADLKRAVEG